MELRDQAERAKREAQRIERELEEKRRQEQEEQARKAKEAAEVKERERTDSLAAIAKRTEYVNMRRAKRESLIIMSVAPRSRLKWWPR